MLVVITGLDGSGTSSFAKGLSERDEGSVVLKTPSSIYSDRDKIDDEVRKVSPVGHMLYYLSSTVYASDKIKKEYDYVNNNVYVVRYFIDTVVSNRVAGIDIPYDYRIFNYDILEPDLTIFIGLDEKIRQSRITSRGKSQLDTVLDNDFKRQRFLEEFNRYLDKNKTIFVSNNSSDINKTIDDLYQQIIDFNNNKSKSLILKK